MTRRCSHCSHNGHNSRTCPNRGVKLFGVRLTDGSIRKSASMGNLSHYAGSSSGPHQTGSNTPGSPGETPDHGAAADGYASEDFVPGSSSSSRERKKGILVFFPSINVLFLPYYCCPMHIWTLILYHFTLVFILEQRIENKIYNQKKFWLNFVSLIC